MIERDFSHTYLNASSRENEKMSNLTFAKLTELVTFLMDSRAATIARCAEEMAPAASAETSPEDLYRAIECFRWNATESIQARYELSYLQDLDHCLTANEESSEDLRWENAKLVWKSLTKELSRMARATTSCSTSPDANLATNAQLAALASLMEDYTGLAKFLA